MQRHWHGHRKAMQVHDILNLLYIYSTFILSPLAHAEIIVRWKLVRSQEHLAKEFPRSGSAYRVEKASKCWFRHMGRCPVRDLALQKSCWAQFRHLGRSNGSPLCGHIDFLEGRTRHSRSPRQGLAPGQARPPNSSPLSIGPPRPGHQLASDPNLSVDSAAVPGA